MNEVQRKKQSILIHNFAAWLTLYVLRDDLGKPMSGFVPSELYDLIAQSDNADQELIVLLNDVIAKVVGGVSIGELLNTLTELDEAYGLRG